MQFWSSLKKFIRAYLFQIALEIMWLPILVNWLKFAVCTLGECTQEGKLQFLAFPFVEMMRLALSHGVPRSEIKNVITQ